MAVHQWWERYARRRKTTPGETIFEEGELGDEMYIIESGEVAIIKNTPDGRPLVLGQRGPGSLLGELSLLADAPRTASAVSITPGVLMVISRESFWRLLRGDSSFQDMVIHTLVDNLRLADQSRVGAAVAERELFDRLGQLSNQNEQLAELMQLRQETIRFIIHDLRSPLNLIKMALEMIEMTSGRRRNERRQRFTAMAMGGVRRMLSLVDVLLDVERLEDGEVALDLDLVDASALLDEVIARHQPLAWACKVELARALSGDSLPPLMIDRLRIDRVLSNLIDNAIKFLPPGGRVTASAKRQGSEIIFTISDNGIGIPADQRERVFERFVQTESGRKASGFGLGLAYCRTAVSAHGGTIRAEEGEGGVGTKMVFTLPVERPQ